MLQLRRHSLFPLVCLLYMATLAVPSVHHLSHWAQPVSDAWHGTSTDASDHDKASDVHVDEDCATCDLIGTLRTVHLDAVEKTSSTHSHTLHSFGDGVYVALHTTSLSARAPPARS